MRSNALSKTRHCARKILAFVPPPCRHRMRGRERGLVASRSIFPVMQRRSNGTAEDKPSEGSRYRTVPFLSEYLLTHRCLLKGVLFSARSFSEKLVSGHVEVGISCMPEYTCVSPMCCSKKQQLGTVVDSLVESSETRRLAPISRFPAHHLIPNPVD